MRSVLRMVALTMAVVGLFLVPTSAKQASRPFVSLLDFDYGTINNWWGGKEDIGKGIADMIIDGLLEDGSYRVIERKKLDAILAEQDFNASDRVDPTAKVAKLGKALGVKYIITGSITKFGTEDSSKGVNGGAFGGGKFGIGSVGKSSGKATVAITARIIDTSTGEIMASAKGEATSKRSGLMLGGGGGGGGKGGGGGLNFGSSNFHDTIIGEATEAAVKIVVDKLIAAKSRL